MVMENNDGCTIRSITEGEIFMGLFQGGTSRLTWIFGLLLLFVAGENNVYAEVHAEFTCANLDRPEMGCAGNEGERIRFNSGGSYVDPAGSLYFSWDFGNGRTSTLANPTHQYARAHNPAATPAGFSVVLTAKDGSVPPIQDTAEASVPIANIQPTAVAYAYDMNQIGTTKKYDEVTIQLEDVGGGNMEASLHVYAAESYDYLDPQSGDPAGFVTSAEWDFDWNEVPETFHVDAVVPSATHVFTEPGTYIVGLRVKDDDGYLLDGVPPGVGYAALLVQVIPPGPWARITKETDDFLEGQVVEFYDNSLPSDDPDHPGTEAPITAWEWDFDYCGEESCFSPSGTTGTVVQHAWADVGDYTVALRVTDAIGRQSIGLALVGPQNAPPEAVLTVREAETPYPALDPAYPGGGDIPTYTVDEGVPLRFDGSESFADPGDILAHHWDWDAADGCRPDESANESIRERVWEEDTDTLGAPIRVCLRVRDDDHRTDAPSEGFARADIVVTDLPPEAEISQIDGDGHIREGETARFSVADIGGNRDAIVKVEWDFSYEEFAGFLAEWTEETPSANLFTVETVWNFTGTPLVAARITDDDHSGDPDDPATTSTAFFSMTVDDMPPTARITASLGTIDETDGRVLHIGEDESGLVAYLSEESQAAPEDIIAARYWDDAFDSLFVANSDWNGLESIETPELDGPASFAVALCVEDEDRPGLCVSNPDPANRWIDVLGVEVENTPPAFDTGLNPPPTETTEDDIYAWTPSATDIAADLSGLSFACPEKPDGMTCLPTTGALEWQPGPEDATCGDDPPVHAVRMTVTDDDGGTSEELSFTIDVANINNCPQITACTLADTAIAGQEYTGRCEASDADLRCGDELEYSLQNAPQGMTVNSAGDVYWMPPLEAVGNRIDFQWCVRDLSGCEICNPLYTNVLSSSDVAVCDAGDDGDFPAGLICQDGRILSNPGSRTLTYTWTQNSGPENLCFESESVYPAEPAVCFATNRPGTYELRCRADNDTHNGPTDQATITVENTAPGADAGGVRHYAPEDDVTLSGSLSGDTNGDALTYSWTEENVPALLDETARKQAEPSFSAPDTGILKFSLTVSDGVAQSDPAELEFEILDMDADPPAVFPDAFIAPVENAVKGGELILDGSASANRSGDSALVYIWTYLDGPVDAASLGVNPEEEDGPRLTIPELPEAGRYAFSLAVSADDRESRAFVRAFVAGTGSNQPPIADAGDDGFLELGVVCSPPNRTYVHGLLDASDSADPEGAALHYRWRQIAGRTVPLRNADEAQAEFTAFHPGALAFELTVWDGPPEAAGSLPSPPAEVRFVVLPNGENPPVAHVAGLDAFGTLTANPLAETTLDASGSADPDGDDLQFEWSQLEGPAVTFSDWTDDAPRFTPDLPGRSHVFRLVVRNESGTPSLPLDVRVEVNSEFNTPPICELGTNDQQAVVCDNVILDGSPSRDEDAGDEIQCGWSLISGPVGESELGWRDSDTPTARFTPRIAGEYLFEIDCFDGTAWCVEPARTKIIVGANTPPVADAGDSRTACVGRTVQLEGNGTDDDGHELSYHWTVIAEESTLALDDASLDPSADVADPSFWAFDTGTAVLGLTVADCAAESDMDKITITVQTAGCAGGDEDEEEAVCVDADNDGYFVGPDHCRPRDCDDGDSKKTLDCDGSGSGGGGCTETPGPFSSAGSFFMLLLAGYLYFQKIRRIPGT